MPEGRMAPAVVKPEFPDGEAMSKARASFFVSGAAFNSTN